MAGVLGVFFRAAFSLASALNDLHERLKPGHQELIALQQRAQAHVLDVLEKIRAVESLRMENGFAMPKTPHRKALRTRRTSLSSRVAPNRQTRSATRVVKKCSSTKKALANDENSSKSLEDPEKENEAQLKTATKGARKKTAPVIKVVPVTPLSQSQGGSLPQSLRSGRQTRAQAKAMAANPLPQTPPQSVSRALLFSSAKRTATPSKQLFSPYAKCSVQEKARAFESKEAISPMRAQLAKSCNALQSEASAATPMNQAGIMTPVPPSPLQAASVQITERGTLTTMEVEEISPRTSIKERRSTRASSAHLSTSESSVPLQPSASQIPEAPTKTVVPCLEEKNLAPSVPEPAATPQKRVTRASVAALTHSTSCEEVPEAVPGPSVAKPVMISPSSSSSSPSPAASDADDEEWVEVDATPKHTRLHPKNVRVGAAGVKKLSGARGLTPKMLGKDQPGSMPRSVRKVSATSSNFKVLFATPKQTTPSKLVRPVLTSETRPGTVKTPYSEESSRKRHDSGASDAEVRKQEILRQKMDAAKKERELRLAMVQAQREQREAQRREQEQQRQREAQQKELERLKQRAEFHQRKQSERSLNIDTLAAAVKRRAESPLVSTSKKACTLQPNKTAKAARTMNGDKEAVKLVFGQPSTSLAQKAKLNNSLQQQAMLNSLSQSLRNQSSILLLPEEPQLASGSESITELVETTPAKPGTALNTTMTLSAADKPAETHNETFTVTTPAGTEPKTPSAANSTFVRTSGPPRSSGYDITPHRSELPPEPNKNKDNYDIDDLNSGDETDDDEKPRKEVPLWAKGVAIQVLISRQNKGSLRGLDLFGAMPVPVLDKIFKEKKKYFNKRTSSALWN